MSTTVTTLTRATILANPVGLLTTSIGLVVILSLVVLLVLEVLLRAHGGEESRRWRQGLWVASLPLLIAAGTIFAARLLSLL